MSGPPIPYSKIRETLRSGDVILWMEPFSLFCPDSWLSAAIRIFSPGYSHASLVARNDEGRVQIIEALSNGVVPNMLSARLRSYKGRAFLLRAPDGVRPECVEEYAYEKAEEGTSYDFPGLFKQIMGRPPVDDSRLWCSEYCWCAWLTCGFWTKERASLPGPRPSDLVAWTGGDAVQLVWG